MTPEQRRAIQIQASHAAPPTSAPTAPPQPIPAPNPTTGLFGNPPPGHPLSAAPGPAPAAAPAALSGAAARPGRAAAIAPPGTARGFGSTQVQFVGQGGANPAVPGAPEVRTRGAGRVVTGPNIGARVEVDSNATRRGGAVPTQPGQVAMQGHAPQAAMAPAPAAAQWMGGQAIPHSMPSAATTQIADLTIMLSQHTRPGFLERQLRTLQSSSIRAAATACFVNPVQGVQIADALLQGIPKIRADRDMGPWMRWRFATEVTTRYVLMLDDDCVFGTTWLQRAMERIIFSESQGQRIIVAAGGIVYTDDNWSSVFPIGPESPPPEEQQVDVARGAWLLSTDLLHDFFEFPRLASGVLTIPIHFAAAMQLAGVPTIALSYPLNDRAAWGMSTPPSADGSMSKMLDSLAAAQRGNSANWHREECYNAYRAAGWRPLVVQKAEQETLREPVAALGVDLGAPPAPVPVPVPAPSPAPST